MIFSVASLLLRRAGAIPPKWNRLYLLIDLTWLISIPAAIWHWGFGTQAIVIVLLILYTLVISITDISARIIPDSITFTFILLGLLLFCFGMHLSIYQALLGAVVGFGFLFAVATVVSRSLGRDAMGGGDIKLAAMLGVFVGWQGVLLVIFLASVLALGGTLVIRYLSRQHASKEIPFGPYLAISGVIVYGWGEQLISVYWWIAQ